MSTSYPAETDGYPIPRYKIENFQPVNLDDGSWTLTDSLGMIDTYANNQIRLNTISDDALQPTVNPTKAPRWTKPATYEDGSPVLGGDNFIMTVNSLLKGSTAGTLRYIQQGLGVCEAITDNSDPLVVNKWSCVGQQFGFSNTDADATGLIIQGSAVAVVTGSANDVSTISTVSVFGRSAANTVVGLDSSGDNDGSNALSFSGSLYASSGQLYVVFLFGAFGAGRSYTAGDGTDVTYEYKFTKIIG